MFDSIKKLRKKLTYREDPILEHVVTLVQLNQQKKYDEELKLIESVFDKERSTHWYNKGNVLYSLSRGDEALECYNEALKLDDRYVKAWYRKGTILFYSKKYLESATCYEKVVELEEEDYLKNKTIRDWSGGAMFYCMLSYVNECITLGKDGNTIPAEIFQKEYYWVSKVKQLLELNKITPEFEDLGQFLDHCRKNLNGILDKLEPNNIVIGHRF